MKKGHRDLVYKIPDHTSDRLVNIRDIFLAGDEIVIVYEQMDGGPLHSFEIEVAYRRYLIITKRRDIAGR